MQALTDNLEEQIKITNNNISGGKNKNINIKNLSKNTWTLPYNRNFIDINHDTFNNLPTIDIIDSNYLTYVSQYFYKLGG